MSNVDRFNRRWFMLDIARNQTFSREEITVILDSLKNLGFNGIGMYLECAFEFKNYPGVVREKVMTYDDAKWFVNECRNRDLYTFPMTNVAGHMNHFYGFEKNREFFLDDVAFQLDFENEKAKDFVMGYVKEYIDAFGADMINIGGDEVNLKDDEQKVAYAKYIGEICDEVSKLGVTPAIWGDMFFANPELCRYINKDTVVFDWWYYGHRPESLQLFLDNGFKNIIACNCDNGWIGLINQQRKSGSREYWDCQQDEVEAFLEDAKKLNIMDGMITDWENFFGRSLWGQWVPIARSALFMNGKVQARQCSDEQIDKALFGRITGYAEATRIMQEGLQPQSIPRLTPPVDILFRLRTSLYEPKFFEIVINQLIKEKPVYFDNYDEVIKTAEAVLDKWTPQSKMEEKCLSAMYKIASMARVVSSMVKLAKGYDTLYVKAAKLQFECPNIARQYLNRFENLIRHTYTEMKNYTDVHAVAAEDTGCSKGDYVRLCEMLIRIEKMADCVHRLGESTNRIPLPRIESLLAHCMLDTFNGWSIKE